MCRTWRVAFTYRSWPSKKLLTVYFLFFVLGIIGEAFAHFVLSFFSSTYFTIPSQTISISMAMFSLQYLPAVIAGWCGDHKIGRWKMILFGWNLVFFSSVLITAITLLLYVEKVNIHPNMSPLAYQKGLIISVCVLLVPLYFGISCITVNLVLLGINVQDAPSAEQMMSYFHWTFWSRNLGLLIGGCFINYLFVIQPAVIVFTIISALACLGLVVFLCSVSLHLPQADVSNPLPQIYKVVKYALKRSDLKCICKIRKDKEKDEKIIASSSEFNSWKDKPNIFNAAKKDYGGIFDNEVVDGVKRFIYILSLMLSLIGYYCAFIMMLTTYVYQGTHFKFPKGPLIKEKYNHTEVLSYMPALSLNLPYGVVFLAVPLLDLLVYPCLGAYTPRIITRIGLGMCVAFLSTIFALAFEIDRFQNASSPHPKESWNVVRVLFETKNIFDSRADISLFVLIPQLIFLGLAECFINIGAYEFVFERSLNNMRSLAMGLLFSTRGVGYAIALGIILSQVDYNQSEVWCYFCIDAGTKKNCIMAYFTMVILLCLCIGLFLWVYLAPKKALEDEPLQEDVYINKLEQYYKSSVLLPRV